MSSRNLIQHSTETRIKIHKNRTEPLTAYRLLRSAYFSFITSAMVFKSFSAV